MYIFVTYGRSDMRGIQVRGLRIAELFDKKEVLFINSGDDQWIKKKGFRYENVDFDRIVNPNEIKFPSSVKALIFADLPTNRLYQISLLIAAKQQKIPVVILDNIYHRGQEKDQVYQNALAYCDAMVLNGLSCLKHNKRDSKVAVVSPLIEKPEKNKNYKKMICQQLSISEAKRIILAIGYNPRVLKIIKKIADQISKQTQDIVFIVVAAREEIKKEKNIIYMPPVEGKKIKELILASDLVLTKGGYLQIIECLSLGTPLIILGTQEERGFAAQWLDSKIKKVLINVWSSEDREIKKIKELIQDEKRLKLLKNEIKKLDMGNFDGLEKTKKIIQEVKYHSKEFPKILLVSVDASRELKTALKIAKLNPFILPIYISKKSFNKLGYRNLADFEPAMPLGELKSSFNIIFSFSCHSWHSLARIFPWYKNLLIVFESLLERADKIILVGRTTKRLVDKLLNRDIRDIREKIELIENFRF